MKNLRRANNKRWIPQQRLWLILLVAAFVLAPLLVPVTHAATITVNSLNDPGDGTCNVSECTLREAIAAASSGDTINFSVTGTLTLTSTLTIDRTLTINGPGPGTLAISRGAGAFSSLGLVE